MSRQTLFAAILLAGVAAIAALVSAQNASKKTENTIRTAPNSGEVAVSIDAALPERKPLSYYTGAVRATMFTSSDAPVVTAKPVVIEKPVVKAAPITVAAVDPFADYSYSGTVMMGETRMALVENSKTREGSYLKSGDTFIGGTVTEINDRNITIDISGNKKMLAKSSTYALLPLDKNAAYLSQSAQAPGVIPGMGLPNMAPGGADAAALGMMGGAGGRQGRFQAMMQNMTPQQREQMQQRMMNRQFNGGGGGGRRGGGGGGGGGFGGGGFGGFGGGN